MRRHLLLAVLHAAAVVVTGTTRLLEAILPGPDDDLMAVAEAAGVTAEQQEARDYHAAACELVEQAAHHRAPLEPFDFEDWEHEMGVGGEPR